MTAAYDRLTALPPPDFIESVSAADLLQRNVGLLSQAAPSLFIRPTDPAVVQAEVFAGQEFALRSEFNSLLYAITPAGASGSYLDQLAALVEVIRQEGESDESLRRRTLSAPHAGQTLTEAGVVAAALSQDNVWDASIAQGTTDVYILQDPTDVELGESPGYPSAALRASVATYLNDRVRSAPGITLATPPPVVLSYYVSGVVHLSPGSPLTLVEARNALDAFILRVLRLNEVVRQSNLISAIEALAGVDYLELTRFSTDESGGTPLMSTIPPSATSSVSNAYSGIVQAWTLM